MWWEQSRLCDMKFRTHTMTFGNGPITAQPRSRWFVPSQAQWIAGIEYHLFQLTHLYEKNSWPVITKLNITRKKRKFNVKIQDVQKVLPMTHNSAPGGFVPILSLSSSRMWFINEILKISRFLPEGLKIDFENTKRASDVKCGLRWSDRLWKRFKFYEEAQRSRKVFWSSFPQIRDSRRGSLITPSLRNFSHWFSIYANANIKPQSAI
jgi:hypothetical protein